MTQPNLAEAIAANAEEVTARKLRENISELQSSLFEKSSAYTNLLLLGGYAGAFTIWNFARSILTPNGVAAVALLLGASLFAFVFFEVYKMTSAAVVYFRWFRAISLDKQSPKQMLDKVQALQKSLQQRPFVVLLPMWIVVMAIAVLGALGGLGILFYSCAATIFGLPRWP